MHSKAIIGLSVGWGMDRSMLGLEHASDANGPFLVTLVYYAKLEA